MLSEAWGGGGGGGQGPYPNFGWNVVLGAGARRCLKPGGGGGGARSVVLGAGARCCLKLGGGKVPIQILDGVSEAWGGARSLSKFWMECCAGGRSKVLSEAWGGQGPYPNFGWNVVGILHKRLSKLDPRATFQCEGCIRGCLRQWALANWKGRGRTVLRRVAWLKFF